MNVQARFILNVIVGLIPFSAALFLLFIGFGDRVFNEPLKTKSLQTRAATLKLVQPILNQFGIAGDYLPKPTNGREEGKSLSGVRCQYTGQCK